MRFGSVKGLDDLDVLLYWDQEVAQDAADIADALRACGHRLSVWSETARHDVPEAAIVFLGHVPDIAPGQSAKIMAEALLEDWDKVELPIVAFYPDPEIPPDPDVWKKIQQNPALLNTRNALLARLNEDVCCTLLHLPHGDAPKQSAVAASSALQEHVAQRGERATNQTFIARMPDLHTPYRYPLHNDVFVGRRDDLAALHDWAQGDPRPVCALIAMGGSGKSALAWRWITNELENLDDAFEGVFWWDFYHDSDAEKCVAHLLAYLTSEPLAFFARRSFMANVETLQSHLNGRRVLVCLDGVERILNHYREFDADAHDALGAEDDERPVEDRYRACARQEGALFRALLNMHKSKALLTSRLLPLDLELRGAPHPSLKQIDKLQMTLADVRVMMDALEVRASDAALTRILKLVAGHPLALRALAGAAKSDHGGDLESLSVQLRRADVAKLDLVGRRSHVLRHALAGVGARSLAVLGAAAAFRGPAALADLVNLLLLESDLLTSESEVRVAMTDLRHRQLLFLDDREGQCDMHPLVRGVVWSGLAPEWKDALAERHGTYFSEHQREHDPTSLAGFVALQHLWFSLLERRRRDEAFEALEPSVERQVIQHGRAIDVVRMFKALEENATRAGEPNANLPSNRREYHFWRGFAMSYNGQALGAADALLDALDAARITPHNEQQAFRSITRPVLIGDLTLLCRRLALHDVGLSIIDRYKNSGSDLAKQNFRAARAILEHDLGQSKDAEAVMHDISRKYDPTESASWTFFRLGLTLRLADLWLAPAHSDAKAQAAFALCRRVLLQSRRVGQREIQIRAEALFALAGLRCGSDSSLMQRSLDRALERARRLRLVSTEALVLTWRLRFASLLSAPEENAIALARSIGHFGQMLGDRHAFARLYAAAARVLAQTDDYDTAIDFARRSIGYSLQQDGSVAYSNIVSDCSSLLNDISATCGPIHPPVDQQESRTLLVHRIQSHLLQ